MTTDAPIYRYDDGELILFDPDLELDYRAPFTPPLIPSDRRHGRPAGNSLTVHTTGYGGVTYTFALLRHRRFEGEHLFVYPDGSLKGRQYYLDGQLHGPSRFYSSRGQLTAEAWFLHGQQVGLTLWYYADGSLYSRQRYVRGLRHGAQEYFYRDGTLKTTMNYSHGKLNGETLLYHSDSALDRALVFNNNTLVSADIQPPHSQKL